MKRTTMATHATGMTALTAARTGKAYRKAAIEFRLSPPMIVWARRILRFGVPELIIAVEEGHIALYMAANLSKWDPSEQEQFLALARSRCGDRTISARCLTHSAVQNLEHEA